MEASTPLHLLFQMEMVPIHEVAMVEMEKFQQLFLQLLQIIWDLAKFLLAPHSLLQVEVAVLVQMVLRVELVELVAVVTVLKRQRQAELLH